MTVYNFSNDGELALVDVRSDRNPGQLYLFNIKQKSLRILLTRKSAIDPKQMHLREPFVIKTTDHLNLYGFTTLPGQQAKNSPTIVIVHGGPYYVHDNFLFDPEAQYLASHGYAVIQVNFRGSGGYGSKLLSAGIKQWGKGMIDDINLATRWAVQQGIADPDRICIFGGSYGAFASISAVIKAPHLYQCAVGYAGIYDLTELQKSDIPFLPYGQTYLKKVLGTDEVALKKQSPLYHTDSIKVPVFIAHGGRDERAPISQAKALRRALKKSGTDFEWLVEPGEGHGFSETGHRINFYEHLLAFFDKNLGTASKVTSDNEARWDISD